MPWRNWGDAYEANLRKGYDHGYAAWRAYEWEGRKIKESGMSWRPIETAPKDGTQILVWSQYLQSVSVMAWHEREGDFCLMADGSRVIEYQSDFGTEYDSGGHVISHWMPLPESPKKRGPK